MLDRFHQICPSIRIMLAPGWEMAEHPWNEKSKAWPQGIAKPGCLRSLVWRGSSPCRAFF